MTVTSARNLNLAGLLNESIEGFLRANVFTALPGRVERFDESTNAVDVKPLIQLATELEDGTSEVESLPVVPNVPLMQFGMGGMRLTFPATPGDTVLLVFVQRSLDKWKSAGGEIDPGDARQFNISDAVAIPGLLPFNGAWAGTSRTDMTLGKDGGPQVIFKGTSIHVGGDNALDAAVLGDKLQTYLDALVAALQTFSTSLTVETAAGGVLNTALGTALTALKVYKSTIVKVK